MTRPYVLYGAQSSYYTARVRACLRKKQIPYIERLPSVPEYRARIRPAAGTHRIPVIETPDGAVIQDSTLIIDHLDSAFPDPPALPPGPRQRLAAELMAVLAVDGLLRPAMHYRWNFPAENEGFVLAEFGRAMRPGGSREEIIQAGRMVADRMASKLPGLGVTPETIPGVEAGYARLLAALDAHFFRSPYFLGDAPSLADYALIGPLYAHLGRDPAPLRLMQETAPALFRWVEQMNAPGLDFAEFPRATGLYPANDALPAGALPVLSLLVEEAGPELVAFADRYEAWLEEHPEVTPGAPIAEDTDQPVLGRVDADLPAGRVSIAARAHSLWMLQRPLDYLRGLSGEARSACEALVDEIGARSLMTVRPSRPLRRVGPRLIAAASEG